MSDKNKILEALAAVMPALSSAEAERVQSHLEIVGLVTKLTELATKTETAGLIGAAYRLHLLVLMEGIGAADHVNFRAAVGDVGAYAQYQLADTDCRKEVHGIVWELLEKSKPSAAERALEQLIVGRGLGERGCS